MMTEQVADDRAFTNPQAQAYKSIQSQARQARWDEAVITYKEVLMAEVVRRQGEPPSQQEFWRHLNSFRPGLGKSALFNRLLDGMAPLEMPPPLSHSYPFYEVVESLDEIGPVSVRLDEVKMADLGLDGRRVWICGHPWLVILEVSAEVFIVSCDGWYEKGFRWSLNRRVTSAITQGQIFCRHNPEKRYLQTVDDLKAESRWWVEARAATLSAAANGVELPQTNAPAGGSDLLNTTYRRQKVERLKAEIANRIAAGKPAEMTVEEIEDEIDTRVNSWLSKKDDFQTLAGTDGVLYHVDWLMKRIAPLGESPPTANRASSTAAPDQDAGAHPADTSPADADQIETAGASQ